MSPSTPLSTVDSTTEVRRYLAWHLENLVPMLLMVDSNSRHVPAYLDEFDEVTGTMTVACMGLGDIDTSSRVSYAVIGSSPCGARFLASGQVLANAAKCDGFKVSVPKCVGVSQSRECYRYAPPEGHFLHFSSPDPHLNDIICRVRDVSLGGLAVVWEVHGDDPSFSVGAETDFAILRTKNARVDMGRLRVVHITHQGRSCRIGMRFEGGAPRDFISIVLDAQRIHSNH